MNFIEWCNNNSGFIGALLSIMTIAISAIAIIISIKMARLPFKKKLKLSGSIGYGINLGICNVEITGCFVSVCNIGNRNVLLKYIGLAIEKNTCDNDFDLLHNIQGGNGYRQEISPSDVFEVEYPAIELKKVLYETKRNKMIYFYVSDTEGYIVKKKFISVGDLLSQLSF